MKYLDICKPLYKEGGNVVARRLDDETEKIHKEGRGEKEEEGLKGDIAGGIFVAVYVFDRQGGWGQRQRGRRGRRQQQ